jgi:hypothetical protein
MERRDFIGSDVDESRLLNEGRADHQPILLRPSHELPTEAGKGTSYDFYPHAFEKIPARFDRAIGRVDLPERCDLFVPNGFRHYGADDTRNTRGLTNSQTVI